MSKILNQHMDRADFGKKSPRQKVRSGSKERRQKRSANQRQPYSGTGLINLEFGNASREKLGGPMSSNRNERHLIQEKQRDPSMDFRKVHVDPSLFRVQVHKKHLERLENDDLDEISKFEVVYKILKD